MATPHVLILRSPGTNCDQETAFAFEKAGAKTASIHVNQLLGEPSRMSDFQILCIPGGFSFGDDIGAGKVLALQLKTKLNEALQSFRDADKLILGICNGFQVLLKTGMLLGDSPKTPAATLTWNRHGRFHDSWVRLIADDQKCVFLRDVGQIELPIAHAEGRFVGRDDQTLDNLESNHQLAIKYCGPEAGNDSVQFPQNPNGSERDVAGVCDPTGRIFGLMPHPERNIDPTHHPNWTRQGLTEVGAGLKIFQNGVAYFG